MEILTNMKVEKKSCNIQERAQTWQSELSSMSAACLLVCDFEKVTVGVFIACKWKEYN